jgi:hypothetical protein
MNEGGPEAAFVSNSNSRSMSGQSSIGPMIWSGRVPLRR